MAQRNARLQVPIDQTVLDQLQVLADDLGFDSVPAMVRFWAKAEINKSRQSSEGVSNPDAQVLRYVELILALNPSKPQSADVSLRYLLRKMNMANFKKFFRDFPGGGSSDKIFDT